MKKPICTFFLSLSPDLKSYFKSQIKGFPGKTYTEPLSLEKLDPKTEILGVFVDSKVDKKVFAALPNLKLIVTFSTGYDHIDVALAKKKKVTVCTVPSYGTETVAEHALTLMLALSKNLFPTVSRVKSGDFRYAGLRGFDLEGKTIGIMGTGRIGARLIHLLTPFNVTVIAYDKFKNKELAEDYGFEYVSKKALFESSDIISLHLPLFPETTHIINKTAIKQMKQGVHIINTARGGLIDSKALVWGLETGQVGAAGLDVLDQENLLEDPLMLCEACRTPEETSTTLMNNLIIDHPKTIVTPHSAFNTTEAVKRIIKTSTDNIKAFVDGEPQNEIKLAK